MWKGWIEAELVAHVAPGENSSSRPIVSLSVLHKGRNLTRYFTIVLPSRIDRLSRVNSGGENCRMGFSLFYQIPWGSYYSSKPSWHRNLKIRSKTEPVTGILSPIERGCRYTVWVCVAFACAHTIIHMPHTALNLLQLWLAWFICRHIQIISGTVERLANCSYFSKHYGKSRARTQKPLVRLIFPNSLPNVRHSEFSNSLLRNIFQMPIMASQFRKSFRLFLLFCKHKIFFKT